MLMLKSIRLVTRALTISFERTEKRYHDQHGTSLLCLVQYQYNAILKMLHSKRWKTVIDDLLSDPTGLGCSVMNSFLRGDCNLLDLAEKNQERERRLDHDAS